MIPLKVWIFIALANMSANAAPLVLQSSNRQTSLLELYTSEGCSSCPPAEAWFSRLKSSPGLWTEFVPVAFHVDYWNHLGWRDPWSKEEYSDRQRLYASAWRAENIYTPEFVLNGQEWRHGLFQKEVPASTGTNAGVLKVSTTDAKSWQVLYFPPPAENAVYEIHAALLSGELDSDVKAGENAGSRLQHDFVAVSFTELPLLNRTNVCRATFALSAPTNGLAGRMAFAAWITSGNETEPVQAVGGWVSMPQ